MADRATSGDQRTTRARLASISAPTISLPKGGGAIRGIGEKFAWRDVLETLEPLEDVFGGAERVHRTAPGRTNGDLPTQGVARSTRVGGSALNRATDR